MRAEIISIGTELLLGSILNTNARFLAQKLSESAVDVYHQVTVGDNIERISACFERALSRADLVISSGGLGPTEDDATLRGLANTLKRPLVLHLPTYHAVEKRLKIRGYRMTKLIAKQCYLPERSKSVFQNIRGTAPGVLYEVARGPLKKLLLVLPGPPRELEPMFANFALPAILRLSREPRQAFMAKSLHLANVAESRVAEKITDLLKWKPPLTVGIYAKPGEVELKIMAKSENHKKTVRMVRKTENILRKRLGKLIYGVDGETLSSAVGGLLRKKKKTLSVAESCTGGLLGHLLTETPGSSRYFLGGIVTYHNKAKTALLKVSPKSLKKAGAVSESVAKQMAKGVRTRFGTDFGIGITGIAGPDGGTKKKPVGLVYIAISNRGKGLCRKFLFFGSRSDIKMQAAKKALNRLRLELL